MLITPKCERNHILLLVYNVHKENFTKSQDGRNFESEREPFVICTRATTLHTRLRAIRSAYVFHVHS